MIDWNFRRFYSKHPWFLDIFHPKHYWILDILPNNKDIHCSCHGSRERRWYEIRASRGQQCFMFGFITISGKNIFGFVTKIHVIIFGYVNSN